MDAWLLIVAIWCVLAMFSFAVVFVVDHIASHLTS
jgi:hypothetical protein